MTLIAQITDLHVRPNGLACYRVSETNMLAERAVRSLLALPQVPDAVVVTGDLSDRDDQREYNIVKRLLDLLPMPVYVIPGNHDTSAGIRKAFADYPGVSDNTGDKLCYTADIGDVRLVALDSSVPGAPHGEIGSTQLAWLRDALKQSEKPTVVAVHHPPCSVGLAGMDSIGLIDSADLAEVIEPAQHVERIICGHVHRPITAAFAGKIMTLAPSVAHQVVLDFAEDAPPQFNFEPSAYFIHQHVKATGLVSHLAYVERFPGPYPFWSDEGVAWPGDED
ncbi:MAG: phosphodiesterase [Rhodobacteraceae bacterium]|nr:phosphodiesterase [Paracoccaceae bacterium]